MFNYLRDNKVYYIHKQDRISFRLCFLGLLVCAILTGYTFLWAAVFYVMYKWFEVYKKYYYKTRITFKYWEFDACNINFCNKGTITHSIDENLINKISIIEKNKVAYEPDSYVLEFQFNNSSEIFRTELTDIESLALFYKHFHNIIPFEIIGSDKFKKRILNWENEQLKLTIIIASMLILGIILIIIT